MLGLAAGAACARSPSPPIRATGLDEHGRFVTATVVREIPTRMRTVVNNIYVRRKVEIDDPVRRRVGDLPGRAADALRDGHLAVARATRSRCA